MKEERGWDGSQCELGRCSRRSTLLRTQTPSALCLQGKTCEIRGHLHFVESLVLMLVPRAGSVVTSSMLFHSL